MKSCLTLTEASGTALEAKINRYAKRCGLIEIRLDFLENPTPPKLPPDAPCRFLATCRPLREGGRFKGSEEQRLQLLQACSQSGFHLVDLEWDVEGYQLPSTVRVVRSLHCFQATKKVEALYRKLTQTRGDIYKLALQIEDTAQLTGLLSWLERLSSRQRYVIVGMGNYGQPARFLGELLGNQWTYVCEEGLPAAPGQFSLAEAEELPQNCTRGWEIYGLLGDPVGHSLSPAVHNALFQHHGLEKVYLPFRLTDSKPWFNYLKSSSLKFAGFSVTQPFKTQVIDSLAGTESPAESINTLVRTSQGWRGYNTDFEGFLRPLRRRLSLSGRKAVVLGNGGAARTVVTALQEQGASLVVVGRNRSRVARFAEELGCSGRLLSEGLPPGDLLVNTTPVGQTPEVEDTPVPSEQLRFELVYDLIYNPSRTRLMKEAEKMGCRTISGREMFVEQAALQFKMWTQITANRSLIRQTVESKLELK